MPGSGGNAFLSCVIFDACRRWCPRFTFQGFSSYRFSIDGNKERCVKFNLKQVLFHSLNKRLCIRTPFPGILLNFIKGPRKIATSLLKEEFWQKLRFARAILPTLCMHVIGLG